MEIRQKKLLSSIKKSERGGCLADDVEMMTIAIK